MTYQHSYELVTFVAHQFWEAVDRRYNRELDHWLASQTFVRTVLNAATELGWWPLTDQRSLELLRDAALDYYSAVTKLASCMTESGATLTGSEKDIWLAAERHVLAHMNSAVKNATSPETAGEALARSIDALTPAVYLETIRKLAFDNWRKNGERLGHALDDWLTAELEIMAGSRPFGAPQSPNRRGEGVPSNKDLTLQKNEASKGGQLDSDCNLKECGNMASMELPEAFTGGFYLRKSSETEAKDIEKALAKFVKMLGYAQSDDDRKSDDECLGAKP